MGEGGRRGKLNGIKNLANGWQARHFWMVHLAHLRLRDFRNYTRLDADFGPGFHLLLGNNAQGKTNILGHISISDVAVVSRGGRRADDPA